MPFDPKKAPKKPEEDVVAPPSAFQGQGNSLRKGAVNNAAAAAAPASAKPADEEKPDPWASLGSGNTLSGRKRAAEKSPERKPASPQQPTREEVIDATMLDEDDFMFGEEYDDDDDDDYIEVDSD